MSVSGLPELLLAATLVGAEPSIQQLAWLVGDWTFEDRSTAAAGFEMTETGTRRCVHAIDDRYIRCESVGTSGGKRRTYVFYFAYDSVDRRFEMVALHGNWPRTLLYSGQLRDDGRTLDLVSDPYLEGGESKRSWGLIRHDGRGSYQWESGTFLDGSTERGPARFRDIGTRTAAAGPK